MNQRATDITIVLDRSGSMSSVKDDTIGGFNTFLQEQQKQPGDTFLTLVQFDHEYTPIHVGRPIKDVLPLTSSTYVPRGSTALHDAICKAIDETGTRLDAMPAAVRPALVIFVIQTDGLENASQVYNRVNSRERIRLQSETYQWQFVYLGANHDAIVEAGKLGIDLKKSMNYSNERQGALYAALGQNVNSIRGQVMGGQSVNIASASLDWSEEQKNEQQDVKP